ncbi:MAG: YDG domain-containing protein [Betaproteobacteria bacterium]|jgi:filamentous hemagglutinin family protein
MQSESPLHRHLGALLAALKGSMRLSRQQHRAQARRLARGDTSRSGAGAMRSGPVSSGLGLHLMAAALAAIGTPAGLLANPLGAQVVQGTATLDQKDRTLTVTTSNGAVIHWNQFNIAAGETTRFVQPSLSSQVLNRVLGGTPSQILGSLQSNGRVYLINPSGIAFGPGAQVDVGALVVSTLKLSDEDFKAGRLRFGEVGAGTNGLNGSSLPGAIRNEGTLRTSTGGFVYLVAPQVENTGLIHSPEGQVLLAAGHKVSIVNPRTPEVSWEVSAPASNAVNLGEIVARQIVLQGQSVKNAGLLRATTAMVDEDGRIVLTAERQVEQTPTGRLTAQNAASTDSVRGGEIQIAGAEQVRLQGRIEATGTGQRGGQVHVIARQIDLSDGLHADVSGRQGGDILVGAGPQGASMPTLPGNPQAATVTMGATATLVANAVASNNASDGHGGRIVLWAEDSAIIHGTLSARGASTGGDGGFIETSGRRRLEVTRPADASAPAGKAGTWLLDPYDIVIGGEVTGVQTSGSAGAGQSLGFSASGTPARVSATMISNALDMGTGVTISTQGGTSAEAGDITLAAPIAKTSGGDASLTLIAHRNIVLADSITASGAGKLDLTLQSDLGQTGAGSTRFNAASDKKIELNGGSFAAVANGGRVTQQGGRYELSAAAASMGRLSVEAGTLVMTAPLSVDHLALTGGLLEGTGALWVRESFSQAGGALGTEHASLSIVQAAGNLSLGPLSTPGTLRAHASAGDLILNAPVSARGPGDAVVLSASGRFVNQVAAGPVVSVSQAGARWLIHSANPVLDSPGQLAPAFREYGRATSTGPYAGPGQGNGFVHSMQAPDLTVAITGDVARVYDSGTEATVAPGQLTVSGFVLRDEQAVLSSASAAYADKNVGSGKTVTAQVALSSVTGQAGNGGPVVVHGYRLASPAASAAVGTIDPRPLTISGISVADKTYDGTDAGVPDVSKLQATGVLGGDDLVLTVTARFSDRHAGVGKTVLLDSQYSGADATNYRITQQAQTFATIKPAPLVIAAVSDSKTYDGSLASAGVPAVTGKTFASDTLLVGQSFSRKEPLGQGLSVLQPTYVLLDGRGGANYQVSLQSASGSILPKVISAQGIVALDKTYDGTNIASLDLSSSRLNGVLTGETVSLSATGLFSDRNAGLGKSVAIQTLLSGPQSSNYVLDSPVISRSASITRAPLTVSGLLISDKVYDGTKAATLGSGALQLLGVLGSDTVRLSSSGMKIEFLDKNVGQKKPVSVMGLGLSGPNASNYLLSQPTGLSASIAARTLSLLFTGTQKVYDGTTSANISISDSRVAGDVLNYSFAANYLDPQVGQAKPISVTGLSVFGADAGNYLLRTPANPVGEISVRPLSTWIATSSGDWSRAANWDVQPIGQNVASVVLPAGVQVTYDLPSLNLASLANAGSLVVAGSGLQIGRLTNSGSIVVNSTLDLTGTQVTGAGILNNVGQITLSGTTLGTALVNSGTVLASGSNSLASVDNSGAFNVSAGVTRVTGAFIQTSGATTLGVAGGGSATLAATAGATFSGGRIQGNGTIGGNLSARNAILAPGFPAGALSVEGDLTLGAGSTLLIELGGSDPSSHDRLSASGNLQLGGQLLLSSLDGFRPAAGQTFQILSSQGAASGSMANVTTAGTSLEALQLVNLVLTSSAGSSTVPTESSTLATPALETEIGKSLITSIATSTSATTAVSVSPAASALSSTVAASTLTTAATRTLTPPAYVVPAPVPSAAPSPVTTSPAPVAAPSSTNAASPSPATAAGASMAEEKKSETAAAPSPSPSPAPGPSPAPAPAPATATSSAAKAAESVAQGAAAAPAPAPAVPTLRTAAVKSIELDPAPAPAPASSSRATAEVSYAKPEQSKANDGKGADNSNDKGTSKGKDC